MRNRLVSSTYFIACSLLTCASAVAQGKPALLSMNPSCTDCFIERTPLVTLGADVGPGMLEAANSRATRDSRGNFYVTQSYGTAIKVFDQSGNFVKTIGRKGGGPGEFRGVAKVHITRGDSIHVYDANLSRHSIFGPDFKLVRSVQWEISPGFIQGVTLPDGRALVNLDIRTPDLIGLPLHLIAANGRVLRSFGSATGAFRPDIPEVSSRAIAPAGPDEVWVAHRQRYLLELIDVNTGATIRSIERKVSWFPPGEVSRKRSENAVQKPTPRIGQIHVDSAGRIWVLIGLADPRWKSAVKLDSNNKGHILITDNAR